MALSADEMDKKYGGKSVLSSDEMDNKYGSGNQGDLSSQAEQGLKAGFNRVTNLLPEAWGIAKETASGLGQMATSPLQTLGNLGSGVVGAGIKGFEMAAHPKETIKSIPKGLEALGSYAMEKPLHTLMNAGMLLEGGGGALGMLAKKVPSLAEATNLGSLANKLQATGKSMNILSLASKPIEMGVNKLAGIGEPYKNFYRGNVGEAAQRLEQPEQTAGTLSSSSKVSSIEKNAAKSLKGNAIFDVYTKAKDSLLKTAQQLESKLKSSMSQVEGGKEVYNALEEGKKQGRALKDSIYAEAKKVKGGIPKMVPERTLTELNDVIERKAQSPIGAQGLKELSQWREKLSKGDFTIDQLKSAKDTIDNMVSAGKEPVSTGLRGELTKIAATLNEEIDAHISKTNPQYGEAMKKADEFNKHYMQFVNGHAMMALDKAANTGVNFSNIADQLVNPSKSLEEIKQAMELGKYNPKAIEALRANTIRQIFKGATNSFTEELGGTKLYARVENFGDKLDAIFGPQDAKQIKDIALLAKAQESSRGISEGMGAFSSGHSALDIFMNLYKNYLGKNRFFSTPKGRAWLTSGTTSYAEKSFWNNIFDKGLKTIPQLPKVGAVVGQFGGGVSSGGTSGEY